MLVLTSIIYTIIHNVESKSIIQKPTHTNGMGKELELMLSQ